MTRRTQKAKVRSRNPAASFWLLSPGFWLLPFDFPHLTWNAALDILIVAFLIYQILVFIKGTRAVQMALGLGLIILFFYFSRWVRLEMVTWMLTNILPYFVFAIIVVFQHEIRRALARFGQAPFFGGFSSITLVAPCSARFMRLPRDNKNHRTF